jgi:uncharacterized iron-regulated membrane protein
MSMTYQQEFVLNEVKGRAAILNLTARQNRMYSEGDRGGWIATFKHTGASFTRSGETFTKLSAAFDGGNGQRLVTVDHDISVDGVDATQTCVALLYVGAELKATGVYRDRLIYERGGWYFTSRELEWDVVPSKDALPV